jgi:hypothetical protein
MRARPLMVLLVAVACGPSRTEVSGPDQRSARALDGFAQDGRFLDWQVGSAFEPGSRVEATDEPGTFVLREPLAVSGRSFDEVLLRVEEGRLVSVTLRASVEGAAGAKQLESWVDRTCQPFTPRVQRDLPSPLGTPEEGQDWDPVQMSEGACEGDAGGVHLALYENQSWASDFHHGEVTVVLTPIRP